MRILVTGSRDWKDTKTIYRALDKYLYCGEVITVVHGAAQGADTIAGYWAFMTGQVEEKHPANWDKYGRRAGYVRNAEMVDSNPDVCLAFIKNNSRGATMCAELAEKAGIDVLYFRDDKE